MVKHTNDVLGLKSSEESAALTADTYSYRL